MNSRRRRYSTFNVAKGQRAWVRGAVRKVTEVSGRTYTFAQFTQDAFTAHLRSLWDDYNEGRPIPPIYDEDEDDDDDEEDQAPTPPTRDEEVG